MLRQRARGVNMVEVMVVVVILGLTIAMALPAMSEWLRDLAVRSAGESIKAGIEKARIEAMRRNTPISFWLVSGGVDGAVDNDCALSATGPSWVVAGADPSGACAAAASRTVLPLLVDRWSAGEGAKRLTLAAADGAGNPADQLQFNSLGQLSVGPVQISRVALGHSGGTVRELQLRINTGGGVLLCDPKLAAGDPRACPP